MIEEPGAVRPHTGICTGASANRCSYCDELKAKLPEGLVHWRMDDEF